MDDSWRTYEQYTAPLGVGFMVRPGHHYGPDVDGYEYTPWGTYHFADRDGVGVDRTRATGTGFTGQYPQPWSEIYESLEQLPRRAAAVLPPRAVRPRAAQRLDGHPAHLRHPLRRRRGVAEDARRRVGGRSPGLVDPALHARVAERLDEQLRCAREWRDQINTYFFRKSGVPDAHGRRIH